MFVNFNESINSKSEKYRECLGGKSPKYLRSMPIDVTTRDFLSFCKNLYEKNNIREIENSKSIKIPKIIHQLWLGPTKIPEEYYEYIDSFKNKHPRWLYIFWDEEKIQKEFKHGFFNQNLFEQAYKEKKFARASDIARYEILYKFGGLYVDLDCQCIKSFDLLHKKFDFYAGLENICNGLVIGNAIIGSKPGHPILKQSLKNIKESSCKESSCQESSCKKIDMKYWKGFSGYEEQDEIDYATTLVTTGPILFTKSIWQKADKPDNVDIIFPPTYFYPCAEYKCYPVKKETFASHFFRGLWKKKMHRKEK